MRWTEEAWKALNSEKYDNIRQNCSTPTDCLINADSSGDELIKPESLKEYQVSPPSEADVQNSSGFS